MTFAAGDLTKQVVVNVVGDQVVEPNQTFNVTLSSPANLIVDDGSGLGTIVNDDAAPTVTIDQAAAQVDPTSVAPIVFTVTFSEPVTGFDDPRMWCCRGRRCRRRW